MDNGPLLAHSLRTLKTALALADRDGRIVYANERFERWFGPYGPDSPLLDARIPGLDVARLRARLDEKRTYACEIEIKDGARAVSVALELKRVGGDGLVLVEAQDVTKQKQVEYMLDSYSQMAERKTRELEKEKERVEKLLLNIMPKSVYEELKDFGTATPQKFDAASVLLLDFVGFTDMAVARDPSALIAELNDIFSAFDRIVELFGCERIKTIGDGYLAVAGLPEATPDHAAHLAKVALRMRRYLEKRNSAHPNQWRCRIGIATGPVIGSLVGIQKYVYDVFGPAINLAARLEGVAEPMQIVVSDTTAALIRDDFRLMPMGEMELKGFGAQTVFSLDAETRKAG